MKYLVFNALACSGAEDRLYLPVPLFNISDYESLASVLAGADIEVCITSRM